MSDQPDVTPQDALAIAQRALAKANGIEDDVEEANASVDALEDRVAQLELRHSEDADDTDPADLPLDDKIGLVREHGFKKATNGHGRAKLDYDDIMWEIFNGEIGSSTCYRLIRRAAGLADEKTGSGFDGFTARDPSSGNYHLAIDAEAAKRGRVFSGGKKPTMEGDA